MHRSLINALSRCVCVFWPVKLVSELIFVTVESECAHGCVRKATEEEREAGMGGISK